MAGTPPTIEYKISNLEVLPNGSLVLYIQKTTTTEGETPVVETLVASGLNVVSATIG